MLYLLLPVLFPILCSLLIGLLPVFDSGKPRKALVTVCLLLNMAALVPVLLGDGETLELFRFTDQLPVFLHVDDTGKVFSALIAFVWAMAGIYSFEYMEDESRLRRYYAFYLSTLGVLMALCFAGSIVTYYMCYELMTLLTVPLVMHEMTKEAVAAGIKYLIYSVLGASLVLLGMFLLSPYITGFSFVPGGVIDPERAAGHESTILIVCFLMMIGFGTKAGMFPLHGWLPTAHPVAPSPASAVLSGIITKAGVLGIIRLIFMFVGAGFIRGTWVQTAFMSLTLFTVFMGSLLAYKESLLKKRLAYSSVSQVSYVLFGLSTLHPLGLAGSLLHVIAHSLIKDTLFMSAGAIIHKTGKKRVDELTGIGRQMPVVMWCFTLVSVGLVGIPPCLGFVSKWYLAQGAMAMNGVADFFRYLGPAVLLISALLTAGYLITISIKAFFPGEDAPVLEKAEPTWVMLTPMLILTSLSLLLGMFPGTLIDFFSRIASALIG